MEIRIPTCIICDKEKNKHGIFTDNIESIVSSLPVINVADICPECKKTIREIIKKHEETKQYQTQW